MGGACKVLLLFLCLWAAGATHAQEDGPKPGFCYDVNPFVGKVIKHTAKFHLPVPAMSSGLDLNFQWKTYGAKAWEQRRRYPTIGLGFTYTNYGNDAIYGRCFSLYPNIIVPLITGEKLEWTIRIGDGVGFVTQRYSRLHPFDTMNNAIGSRANDYASFMMDARYHVNKHLDIQAGVNFSHISDASYHQPNLGVNLAGAHLGFRYFPVSSKVTHIKKDLKPLSKRWLAQFRASMAYTAANAPLGPAYPVFLGTAYASKRWISKNKLMLGADYSFHESIYSFLLKNQVFEPQGTEAQHSWKSAVFVGNEFLLGRLGVVLQVGYYVHQAYQVQGKIYEKLGGHLYLVKREHGPIKELFLSGLLKTHFTVAELAEFGFGMGF